MRLQLVESTKFQITNMSGSDSETSKRKLDERQRSGSLCWREAAKSSILNFSRTPLIRTLQQFDSSWHEQNGPIKVLFVASTVQAISGFLPLMQTMIGDGRIKVNIVTLGVDGLAFDNRDQQELYRQCVVPKLLAFVSKYHYIFFTDVLDLPFLRTATHISMSHGAAFGVLDYMVTVAAQPHINLIFALSSHERKYFEEADLLDTASKLFFAVGCPKLDPLLAKEFSRLEFMQRLNLRPDRKNILIATHFSEKSLLFSFRSNLLKALLPLEQEYNIMITGHPMIWQMQPTTGYNPPQIWEEIESVANNAQYVRTIRTLSELPLLDAADLLIADHSSIVAEYSCLDRPMLLFDHPDMHFQDSAIKKLFLEAAASFVDVTNIGATCRFLLNNPSVHSEGRHRMTEHFFYQPGNSCKYIIELLLSMGRMCGPHSHRWQTAAQLSKERAIQPNIGSAD